MRLAGPLLNRRKEREAAEKAIQAVALERPVETLITELSPGEKTLVAVARLLDRGARVLFIDEATSTLPPGDAHRLIRALRATAEQGATVIMVSHKLSEILDATDRDRGAARRQHRRRRPVGRSRPRGARQDACRPRGGRAEEQVAAQPARGDELLRMEGVHAGRAGPIDLTLCAGEIVGLTGLPGSGLHDVAYARAWQHAPQRGRVVRAPGVQSALVPPHRETPGRLPRARRARQHDDLLDRRLAPSAGG